MPEPNDSLSPFLPLREPTFFILLSLVDGEKHGYGILKEVEAISQGKLKLSTGTLYEALLRLHDQGLVERMDSRDGEAEEKGLYPGKPRKAYRLTDLGGRVIAAEAARLSALSAVAHSRLQRRVD